MFYKNIAVIKLLLILILSNNLRGGDNSRHILALYNSALGQTTTHNLIHENAEVILNHLGCVVDYWDIKDGLPDENHMQKYFGVIAWFHGHYTDQPDRYFEWASKQVESNRKFVILGDIGDFNEPGSKKLDINLLNRFCNQLGFKVGADWTNDVTKIELVFKDSKMVEFERDLDKELNYYRRFSSINPLNRVYLKLRRRDIPNSESDLVLTTPRGGFACTPYIYYQHPVTFKKKWRINPFRFFEEAFGLKNVPKPDVTTLNGLRIWCSHIDGDALISRSEIKPNAFCSEIIRDEILKKYKWPVSVSVVVGEVEQDSKFVDIARSIFRIRWVEAASHSYAHPFYWADDYEGKRKYPSRHLNIKGYTFNLRKEIIGSVDYINDKLLPPGKKAKIFFWTGNCEPTIEAMKLCEENHLYNFNGGDTVYDKSTPSYTSVAPLGAKVGGYQQVYSPSANENIYTNEWQGPYFGFRLVLETFKNTESPIRIKPIDVYYHYYSGEKWAALNALKEVLDKTIIQDVAPMFVSEYIAVVQGFHSAQIEKISNHGWKVKNFGKCTTIRFDNTRKYPDFRQSSGILGFLHHQGSLYLHLDNEEEAVIVLTDSEPNATYLEQGSHRLFDWRATKNKVSFKIEGFGQGKFVIANLLKNKKYEISIEWSASSPKTKTNRFFLQTDSKGKLSLQHPMDGAIKVVISSVK